MTRSSPLLNKSFHILLSAKTLYTKTLLNLFTFLLEGLALKVSNHTSAAAAIISPQPVAAMSKTCFFVRLPLGATNASRSCRKAAPITITSVSSWLEYSFSSARAWRSRAISEVSGGRRVRRLDQIRGICCNDCFYNWLVGGGGGGGGGGGRVGSGLGARRWRFGVVSSKS